MSSTGPSDRCTFVAVLAEQYSPAVNISESPGRKNPASRPVSANITTNTPSAPRPASQKEADRGLAAAAPVAARNGCAAPCRTCTVAPSFLLDLGLPSAGAGDWPVAAVARPATGRSPAAWRVAGWPGASLAWSVAGWPGASPVALAWLSRDRGGRSHA